MKPKPMKYTATFHTLILIAVTLAQSAVGQSNYASHANNVDYLGKGLPEEATLDGKVSKMKKRTTNKYVKFLSFKLVHQPMSNAAISIPISNLFEKYNIFFYEITR